MTLLQKRPQCCAKEGMTLLLLACAVVLSEQTSGSIALAQGSTATIPLESSLDAMCKNSGFTFTLLTACSLNGASVCGYAVSVSPDNPVLSDFSVSTTSADTLTVANAVGKGTATCYEATVTNEADGDLVILYSAEKALSCRIWEKAQGVLIVLAIPFMALFVMWCVRGSRKFGRINTPIMLTLKHLQILAIAGTAALRRPAFVRDVLVVSNDYALLPSFDTLVDPDCAFGASTTSSTMPSAVKWMMTALLPEFIFALFTILAGMIFPLFYFSKRLDPKSLLFAYLRSFFWTLMVLYVPISLAAFVPWSCQAISGVWVVQKYPTIMCFHDNWEWVTMTVISGILVIVHVVGIPAMFITVLVLAFRSGVHDQLHFLATFGFMFNRYEPKFRWYEVVEMAIKLSIVLCRLFLGTTIPLLFCVALNLILFADMILKLTVRPYAKNWEDILAITVTMANVLVGVCALYSACAEFFDFSLPAAEILVGIVLFLAITWVILTALFVFLGAGCLEEWQDRREFRRKRKKLERSKMKNAAKVYDIAENIIDEDNSDDERADLNMKKKNKKEDLEEQARQEMNPFEDTELGKARQLDPTARVSLFLNNNPRYLELSDRGEKDDVFLSLITHYEFLVEQKVDEIVAVSFVKAWEKFFRTLERGEKKLWREGLDNVVRKTPLDEIESATSLVTEIHRLWTTKKKNQMTPFVTNHKILKAYEFVRNGLPYDPLMAARDIFAIERQLIMAVSPSEVEDWRGIAKVLFHDCLHDPDFTERIIEVVNYIDSGKFMTADDAVAFYGAGQQTGADGEDEDPMVSVDGMAFEEAKKARKTQLNNYYAFLLSSWSEDDAISMVNAWEIGFFDKIEQGKVKSTWRHKAKNQIVNSTPPTAPDDAKRLLERYRQDREEQKNFEIEAYNWPDHVYRALQIHYSTLVERYHNDPIQAFKIVNAWENDFFDQVEDIDKQEWRIKLAKTIELTPFGPKLNQKINKAVEHYKTVGEASRAAKAMYAALEEEFGKENVAKMQTQYPKLMKLYNSKPREGIAVMMKWENDCLGKMDLKDVGEWREKLMPAIVACSIEKADAKIAEVVTAYEKKKHALDGFKEVAKNSPDGDKMLELLTTHYAKLVHIYVDDPQLGFQVVDRWEQGFFDKLDESEKPRWRKLCHRAICEAKFGPELEQKLEKCTTAYIKSKKGVTN